MSCSYADIAMADFDKEALEYHLSPTTWKRFLDDIFVLSPHGRKSLFVLSPHGRESLFVLSPHGRESLVLFLHCTNTLDPTMEVQNQATI